MENFEVFLEVISSSINLLFLKSAPLAPPYSEWKFSHYIYLGTNILELNKSRYIITGIYYSPSLLATLCSNSFAFLSKYFFKRLKIGHEIVVRKISPKISQKPIKSIFFAYPYKLSICHFGEK